ncbi:MAG: hypothetical protein KTR32_13960 [Granulosicoccus sp.]|nr:hypothetical protein [Granulosicoccus sp.]
MKIIATRSTTRQNDTLAHKPQLTHPLYRKSRRVLIACTALLMIVSSLTRVALADIGATHTSLVSEFASFNTPGTVDGRVEAIAIDGDTVFVGGTFTQIHDPLSDQIINQPYLFAYSKSSGNIIQDFDPVLDNEVFALETTGEGTGVFAGGVFARLNGEINRRGLVKIDNMGDRVPGFSARPNALVKTMVRLNNTLYIGGNFSSISGTSVENLAAIDTLTGAVDPNLNLDFSGTISTGFVSGVQGVDDIDITSDGQLMVVVGNFLNIDGFSRPRLAVLELAGQAQVSNWNTNVFDIQCPVSRFPQYIKGMDIAPDNSYFVTGTTGFTFRETPRPPACDSILRFDFGDLSDTDAQPTWGNFTGGDSVYEVVATDHAIYAGGHFRWLNNETTSDRRSAGPGSVERRGLAALDPLNGLTLLDWRADRSPRGVGTFALIAEDEGLYIGDDTDFLNGTEHPKLKFLPISTNTIQRPDVPTLPTTIFSSSGDSLDSTSYDGSTLGVSAVLQNSGWGDVRGAMFVGGNLYQADASGGMWVSAYNGSTFEPRESVNLFGLTESYWALSQIGGMFFDYEQGRVYYTLRGNSQLYYRAFSPDGPYFGNDISVAEVQGDILWSDVTGMDVIDGDLYFGRTNGNLYRAEINGANVVSGTTQTISGPFIDGRNWDDAFIAFSGQGTVNPPVGVAEFEFQSSGSDTIRRFQTFQFPVVAGEEVIVRLAWLDPSAKLDLRVRDSNNVLVASDTTAAGSPKWLTVPAGVGGTYTASVMIQQGTTAYNLQVNPVEQPPAPLADFEFNSGGDQNSGRFQSFDFDVSAGELVEAQITWDDPNAEVRAFLRDESGTLIERDIDGSASPIMLSTVAQTSGQWSVAVLIANGATNYDVLIDTDANFVPPQPLADFEFSSSGDQNSGRFQSFNFDVVAGELVEAQVTWADPNAEVRMFLRDESGNLIERDIAGGTAPIVLSTVAQTSGQWSVAVLIANGATSYDVLIDTTANFVPPQPLADFEFSSSGDQNSGRFQIFAFDVVAGELVDVQVIWEDLNQDINVDTEVRVFLRDETNTMVVRYVNGGTAPISLSTVAQSSGQWSIAVLVRSGAASYDVLADTTP